VNDQLRFFLISLCLLFSAVYLFGQETTGQNAPEQISPAEDLIELAREYESAGVFEKSFGSYCSYLKKNLGMEDFEAVFIRAFSLPIRVGVQLDCLYSLLENAEKSSHRYMVLEKTAQIEEFLGRLAEAQQHYEEAAFLIPEKRDFLSLFRSAFLLYELGFFERSFAQAKTIRSICNEQELVDDAVILSIRILYAQNKLSDAEALLATLHDGIDPESITADQLYNIHQLAVQLGMQDEAAAVSLMLETEYPKSVPAYLLDSTEHRSRVTDYPTPAALLSAVSDDLPEEKEPGTAYTGVQTGSFIKREYAERMAAELKEKGFGAVITEKVTEGNHYHKVIVPVPENANPQKIIIRLKENGYEGFLLSDN
jgi:tetratricopeptide (TPR) repeat protein